MPTQETAYADEVAMLPREAVRGTYERIASRYDLVVKLFPLFGVRMGRYRRIAVRALNVRPGATIVELGCGTGLNFPLLYAAVGPRGRIIGVDFSRQMLEQARRRAVRHSWANVEFCHCDIAEYRWPSAVDAVLSTFAITLSPDFDAVIGRGARALNPHGRLVILDLKYPEGWPDWLVRLAARLNRPFAVTLDLGERHPWESIAKHMRSAAWAQYYGGAVYVARGMSFRTATD